MSVDDSSVVGQMKDNLKLWWQECTCGNGQRYRAACDSENCLNFNCENGQGNNKVLAANGQPGSMVLCAPIYVSSDNKVHLDTHLSMESHEAVSGAIGNTGALLENQINPYSRNEIPLGCLMQLPEAKTWIKNEQAWSDFQSSEKNQNASLQGLRIQIVGVSQTFGDDTFGASGKNLARVIEGQCRCGDTSWAVWNHALYADWLKAFAAKGYENQDQTKLNKGLQDVCKGLKEFCDKGTLDINSCRPTKRRQMSRTIALTDDKSAQCPAKTSS